MSAGKAVRVLWCAVGVAFAIGPPAWAEEGKTLDGAYAAAAEAAKSGHNAWMLTSCALVLLMTAPGLALFYSGLVRKKNVLGVMMQCVFLMGMLSIVWALWGYSLAFGGEPRTKKALKDIAGFSDEQIKEAEEIGGNRFIGNFQFFFMKNVQTEWDEENKNIKVPQEGLIPRLTHMLFQGMFFIITPALICGAFAERMRFSTMVVFMLLWGTFVYCPIAHWVWDYGLLGWGGTGGLGVGGGALDFAGGTVVHISSGVSALICALVLGKRLGYGAEDMRPHNMTYTAIGAALLWVGWFGFNAGSQLASDGVAASAFAATHFAAAAAGLAWAAMEWNTRGKPSVLGMCSGVVAGLVCITPASGYVQPMPAILMGFAAGIVCFLACTRLKSHFGYDDSLDAFGVHGVGGTLGALLTGVFATRAVQTFGLKKPPPLGIVDGAWSLLGGQILAVIITWVYAAGVTFLILKLLDNYMGLRVSQEEETVGLDLSQHGEEGYIFA